jgi:hypothetical protein
MIFFIIFTLIFLNPLIAQVSGISYFKFLDDIFLVVLFFLIFINLNDIIKIVKKNYIFKKIIILILFISIIGIIALVNNSYALSTERLVIGYLFFMKPFILLISGIIVGNRIFKVNFIAKLYIYVYFLFTLLLVTSFIDFLFPSLWLNIVPGQYANGILRLRSIFTNAGRTSWFFGLLIIFLISNLLIYRSKFKYLGLLPLAFLFEYLTYVKKTLLGIIATIGYINFRKKITILKIIFFSIFLFIFIFIFQEQFLRFFSEYSMDKMTEKNSRIMLFFGSYELLKGSITKILFGIGFGTWGGYASSIVYSPYYYDLGFDKLWGFIPGASSYTGDNYIAHIITEIGFIGTFLLFLLYIKIFQLYKYINTYVINNNFSKKIKLFSFFFLLAYIEVLFELLGICAVEISTVSYFIFFLSGIYIGIIFKHIKRVNIEIN